MCMIVMAAGCGKKKKISYGDTTGVVSGSIDFTDSGAELNLNNVIAAVGSDIDYTSAIKTSGDAGDYSMEVNASNVKYDKPGTYTANYTVTAGDNTYTDSIKVTISEDADGGANEVSQDNGSVSDGSGLADNGGNNASSNEGGSSNTSNGGDNSSEQNGNAAQPTTSKTLITDGSTNSYGTAKIPNAVIELMSGDVVTISCSTQKYIVATRTDESQTEKNGHNYKVTKLIVVFNTGAEQTLETVEKKID